MSFDTSKLWVVDTFLSLQDADFGYSHLIPLLQGQNKRDATSMPAGHLFKDSPVKSAPKGDEAIRFVLDAMDKHGVNFGLVDATDPESVAAQAIRKYPERFGGTVTVNGNDGMDAVAQLAERALSEEIYACSVWPAFECPQVPINDKKYYPIYAKCSELGIPVTLTTGIPGPRIPMMAQHVELLDEVCWFFPDLKIVMYHGGEPWTDVAVKLMLRWPNLYYATSAFAPKHYPKAIVEAANKRLSNQIIYAGYFPIGLSLDRIFSEMPNVPFREEVWPKFLGENAIDLFGLDRVLKG